MAEKVLSVRLRAVVDGYQRAMDSAARSTEQMATRAERVTAIGDRAQETGGKLTRGLTLPIAAVGTAALVTAGQFEAGMREVQALTSGTASEMEMLQGQAMKMGAETQFSATQAADAMSQLVKGGFDVRQTYEALPGVMQLAAAASLDIASAADIATNVLSGFGLEVENLAEVNDFLSQTANSSDTDVRELGEAFKYVGPVARGAGLSLEETTATMGLLAENGIRGSMAGTALRGSITALLNPSKQVADVLESLGINVVDSSGQLTSMQDVVKQLGDSGATTAEIMEIFGQRAGPAMVALVSQGSESLGDFTKSLEESRGVAQNLADAKMGGLTGAIEQLKGSLETLAITVGEAGLVDFMTGLAGAATGLVNKLGELPDPVQRVGLVVGGLAAASGPAIWAFGKLTTLYGPVVSGMQRVIGSLQGLRVQLALARASGLTTGGALLSMFGPGAAIIAGIAALAGVMYLARRRADEFARSHQHAGDAAVALAESAGIATRELSELNDEQERGMDSADDFRKANEDAILTLREFENAADQEAFLWEVGYELTLRGASPEDAFREVERLAAAAGVELPVDMTVRNIDEFENQVDAVVTQAQRVMDTFDDAGGGRTGLKAVQSDLDNIARTAADMWQVGDTAGFVTILAAAEDQLGDNAAAINYLTDQAMKYSDVAGLNVTDTKNVADALADMGGETSAADQKQRDLLQSIMDTASEMDGGLTPANVRAAAAQLGAGEAAEDYAAAVSEAEGPVDDATGAIGELEGALGDQEQAAKDAEQALEDYLDTLRGSIDPFFAMASSLRDNGEAQFDLVAAQNEYDEAVREHGPNSLAALEAGQKLSDAQQRVAETAMDVTEASLRLKEGLDNGSISMETANLLLLQWTSQGLIGADVARRLGEEFGLTALQAGAAAEKTKDVHGAVQDLDGASATVTITIGADATQFWRSAAGIDQWQQRYGFFRGGVGFIQAAPDRQRFGGGRASGGPVRPGVSYTVGEHGPETLHMFPSGGGFIDPGASVMPAMSGMSDSRIVAAIGALGDRVGQLESAPLFGEYHVHTDREPQSFDQLNRDAQMAKALMG